MDELGGPLLKLLEIIWINVILSGDNALVIAMACRGLPGPQRRMGMILGAGVAVGLRIVFTILVVTLLATPLLKLLGGILLAWVAVKLLAEQPGEDEGMKQNDRLWQAVRAVAVADIVMSLDNVLAIAAIADDSIVLLVLGLAISVPLIVAGASLIMSLLDRFPVFVWAGAGLLGFLAGQMLVSDPWVVGRLGAAAAHDFEIPVEVVGIAFVLGVGFLLRSRAAAKAA